MSLILLFRKLIKIIRGDNGPRQVGLGILLGVMAGLPPFSLLSVLLILLFFTLSANLGAFLLAMGLAKGLRVAFPGVFDSLGRALLENESLKETWRALLNLPVVATFGLDRYLSMGALVVALVLGGAGLLISWLFLDPIRGGATRYVESSPRVRSVFESKVVGFFVWLLFGKKKDVEPDAASRWIRKGFAIPAVLTMAAMSGLAAWKGDQWAQAGIEFAASTITGNEVRIADTRLKIVGGSLQLGNVEVTKPGSAAAQSEAGGGGGGGGVEKVAEGQQFRLNMALFGLLDRRLRVEDATVENFTYHADARDAPQLPPSPAETPAGSSQEGGDGVVDLEKIVRWVDAHEKQLEWVLQKIDEVLKKGNEPPDPESPRYDGRAAYVYARPEVPGVIIDRAGVRNLKFDWTGEDGPLTRLKQIDLSVEGLSSNPVIHGKPITFLAGGGYGDGALRLTGTLDARSKGENNHRFAIDYQLAKFAGEKVLGLGGGKDLELEIELNFAPGTRAIRSAACKGSFSADNPGSVAFILGGGPEKRWELTVKDLDVAGLTNVERPSSVDARKGVIDLKCAFGREGEKLAGTLALQCRNLEIQPGKMKSLGGMDAGKLCQALNEITTKQPLGLTFRLGGTSKNPSVSMEDAALKQLFEDVKKGLLAAGKQQLASEMDKHLSVLTDKLGADLQEKLGDKLGDQTKDLTNILEGDGKKTLEEGASSVLDGLFGKKKKEDKKVEEKKDDGKEDG